MVGQVVTAHHQCRITRGLVADFQFGPSYQGHELHMLDI